MKILVKLLNNSIAFLYNIHIKNYQKKNIEMKKAMKQYSFFHQFGDKKGQIDSFFTFTVVGSVDLKSKPTDTGPTKTLYLYEE